MKTINTQHKKHGEVLTYHEHKPVPTFARKTLVFFLITGMGAAIIYLSRIDGIHAALIEKASEGLALAALESLD